jgi:hypothetical protein
MVQAYAAGTFFGSTVVFTSATTLLGNVRAVKWTGITRNEINTTGINTTDGVETFITGDILNAGELEVEAQYSTQLNYMTLLLANRNDTVTITFPKRSTTCNGALASSAASIAFPVAILSAEPEWPNDGLLIIKFKLKVSGKPTTVVAN